MSFITTTSGLNFYYSSPFNPQSIKIKDIAHSLSMQCRFNGHTHTFYSVAEHSVKCLELMRNMGIIEANDNLYLACLMHDASEAYLGDVMTPLKNLLPTYKQMESELSNCIGKKYRFDIYDSRVINLVKYVDMIMLKLEAEYFFPENTWSKEILKEEQFDIDPVDYISCWNPFKAYESFMTEFDKLVIEHAYK